MVYQEDPFQRIVNVGWPRAGSLVVVNLRVSAFVVTETSTLPDEAEVIANLTGGSLGNAVYDLRTTLKQPANSIDVVQVVTNEMLSGLSLWGYVPYHNVTHDQLHVDGFWTLTPDPPELEPSLPDFPPPPGQWATEAEADAAADAWRAAHPEFSSVNFFVLFTDPFDESETDVDWGFFAVVNPAKFSNPLQFRIELGPIQRGLVDLTVYAVKGRQLLADPQNGLIVLGSDLDILGVYSKSHDIGGDNPPSDGITTFIEFNKLTNTLTGHE